MCAVLSSSCKSPSSPTLVDTEPIMATLNIGYLRISCSAQTPSGPRKDHTPIERGWRGEDEQRVNSSLKNAQDGEEEKWSRMAWKIPSSSENSVLGLVVSGQFSPGEPKSSEK